MSNKSFTVEITCIQLEQQPCFKSTKAVWLPVSLTKVKERLGDKTPWPKLQLWDYHLAKWESWWKYKSLYGNIFDIVLNKYLTYLSISRFTTLRRRTRLHTPFPHTRSEKRKIWAQNDRVATDPTQNPSTYAVISFQFTTNSIFPVKPTLSRSLFPRFLV